MRSWETKTEELEEEEFLLDAPKGTRHHRLNNYACKEDIVVVAT